MDVINYIENCTPSENAFLNAKNTLKQNMASKDPTIEENTLTKKEIAVLKAIIKTNTFNLANSVSDKPLEKIYLVLIIIMIPTIHTNSAAIK